jgi:predicted nucleic acid-binding protein
MARRTEAYVDTSALIAFGDRSDSYHFLFRRLFSEPPPLLTTALVVTEGHGWFLKRYDRARALQFIAMIEEMEKMEVLEVLAAGPQELHAGARMLRRLADQDLTLVDAVGLHVMTERRTGTCWSTDFHLGLTGVPLVIHER